MLIKGKQVNLRVASLAPGGQGVSKDFPVPVFIDKAAPGDVLLAEIYDHRRSFAKANLIKVLEASEDRIEPECKLFKVCGGCQWMHLNYQAQLNYKRQIIEQSLYHIAGKELGTSLSKILEQTIPSPQQFFYRNKVQFPVRNPKDSKRLLAGYYETNSHNLVNIKHCPIQPSILDTVLEQIKVLAEQYGIPAYDEISEKGLLRHIHIRINQKEDSILVTLVLNCKPDNLPGYLKDFAKQLQTSSAQIKGVCINYNNKKGNRILGEQTDCLSGVGYIEEVLATDLPDLPAVLHKGIRFRLSPESFFQINTPQTTKMLELIAREVQNFILDTKANDGTLSSSITLVDAYAGVGTIALWLAPFISKVIAIESNPQAVKDGEFNRELNELDNVQFKLAKVEDYLAKLKDENQMDILILDPPRQGLHPDVIQAILKAQPKLIIYISCNPVTLSRDLRLILSPETINFAKIEKEEHNPDTGCLETYSGYKVEKITPLDLFPQTYHIESISILKKQ